MPTIRQLSLTEQERKNTSSLLHQLATTYSSAEDPDFLERVPLLSHRLPERVCEILNDFKYREEGSGVALISGNRVDDLEIGPTPLVPMRREDSKRTQREQMLLVLYASLLGDVFGWATQQAGHLVHDVFPAKEHENDQIGFGSKEIQTWHVEDAFHPFRGDYVGLLCLRNPCRARTMVASIADIKLDDHVVELLFESRYTIRPDESHLSKNRRVASIPDTDIKELDKAYGVIERMSSNPPKVPVFFGDRKTPYLRLDPYFMDPLTNDSDACLALNKLIQEIDSNITDLVLEAGDCLFLDNYRVVHGRRSFIAKYDGTDRWLKRVNITRDLRRSREARLSSRSRVIF
jgi:Fe(II)/alpha-ketoglutarate-dependent arginine beta-hydroxylase